MQIFIVMVRYKTPLGESRTLQTLTTLLAEQPQYAQQLRIMIWDNSPQSLSNPDLPFPCYYHHSKANVGVAAAYNKAATMAEQVGASWLLLLDQDTVLPSDFLECMFQAIADVALLSEVAAIVPAVFVSGAPISPWRVQSLRNDPYTKIELGLTDGETCAINSGAMLRLSALEEIGGFSLDFWLDYSDWYLFHQLYRAGKKIWRAPTCIQHSMAIVDIDNMMPVWRYASFIQAEGAFHDLFRSRLENLLYSIQLCMRAASQRRRFRNQAFTRITARHIWTRIRYRRKSRIERWKRANADREHDLTAEAVGVQFG